MTRGPHDLVFACSGRRTWLVLPPEQIAMIRDEGTGRVEITCADGRVAHRPADPGPMGKPWMRIAPGLFVHPALVRQVGDEVVCPGGWRFPCTVRIKPPATPPPEAMIPEIGARPGEVLYLRSDPGTHSKPVPWIWVTDRGVLPVQDRTMTGRRAAALHGGLVQIGTWHVNLRRVRAVEWRSGVKRCHPTLVMEDGAGIRLVGPRLTRFRDALGIDAIDHFQEVAPEQAPMYRLGLRDYPFELAEAPASVLRQEFGQDLRQELGLEVRRLIANVVWQTCRYRRLGHHLLYGTDHRGFWYHPLLPILERAGVFTGRSAKSRASERLGVDRLDRADQTSIFYFFELVLTTMIREDRLLTYEDLGFDDRRPDLRRMGERHPEVILVVEKDTVAALAFEVARRFGVTILILGGAPELVVVEPFVKALKKAWSGPVRIVGYVDYDADGYVVARAFADQLRFYGVDAGDPAFLVTPHRFTPRELDQLSVPLGSETKERQSVIAAWLAETGGIHGRPRGIHCDHLRPLERVLEAFAEVSGLTP